MKRTTEEDSNYNHLEKMSVAEILQGINEEDKS
ncbi:MAG: N-acetylmuramic acid 6-phosphate etherase, partial [Flavobacterium sp.]|nr:N-acetylmuramic acid 6-phosphate etherase [Pedobacter sp.]